MTYVTPAEVQQWLNEYKYEITEIDPVLESTAAQELLGKVGVRYDTSVWTDSTNTPVLIRNLISMLVASYTLRRATSEEEGLDDYPTWLERRALRLADDIANGVIDLPDAVPDDDRVLAESLAFFPTDASTALAKDYPNDPNGSPLAFEMNRIF